jgi:hypothetical protein
MVTVGTRVMGVVVDGVSDVLNISRADMAARRVPPEHAAPTQGLLPDRERPVPDGDTLRPRRSAAGRPRLGGQPRPPDAVAYLRTTQRGGPDRSRARVAQHGTMARHGARRPWRPVTLGRSVAAVRARKETRR